MTNKIKICKGPGCKAWNSEGIASQLSQTPSNRVCLVPCMKRCGGGASVRLKDRAEVLKLRETAEVAFLLESGQASLVATC